MKPSRALRRVLVALPVLVLLAFGGLSCASMKAPPSGLVDGALRPCPDTPNCVSSLAGGSAQVAPLVIEGEPGAAFQQLLELIDSLPRTERLYADGEYAHFQFTTRILRFRDDLELQLAPAEGVVHVRSASRVGHSDLGANRDRVESLRAAWQQARAGREHGSEADPIPAAGEPAGDG